MSGEDAVKLSWRAVSAALVVLAYVAGSTGFVYQADAKAVQALAEARQVRADVSVIASKLEERFCALDTRLRSGEQSSVRTEEALKAIYNQLALIREDFKRIR